MEYFDSDVVFNCIVEQDIFKHKQANDLLLNALKFDNFIISTLVITEVGYGLARFEMPDSAIKQELDYFKTLSVSRIEASLLTRALALAEKIGFKHVNDCLHAAVAESLNCEKLYTYNKSDFKRIQKHTDLNIVIL